MKLALALAVTLVIVTGCYKEEAEGLARENAELRGRVAELERRAEAAESKLSALEAKDDAPPPPTIMPLDEVIGEKLRAGGVSLQETDAGLRWSANGKGGPIKGELTLTEADTRGTLLGRTKMKSFSVVLSVRVVDDSGVILKNIREQVQVLGISPAHAVKAKGNGMKIGGFVDQAVADIVEAVK